MTSIIGDRTAGYDIIDAIFTGQNEGYAIGKSTNLYAVWYFRQTGNRNDYYNGKYFIIDHDAPARSRAMAYTHFHRRAAETFARYAKYGC